MKLLLLRYWLRAPLNGQVWHKAFFGGSGCRAVAHTRPAFPKNAYGPVGIPLIRGASGAWRLNPTSPKGVKAWGEGPLRPKEIIQLPRHTRPDPPRSQHGRPKCDPTNEWAKYCFKLLLLKGTDRKLPSCSKVAEEEVVWRVFTEFDMPGKVIQAEWDSSSPLGEIIWLDQRSK